MSAGRRTSLENWATVLAVALLGALVFLALRTRGPYNVEARELSGWKLVRGEPGDSALLALEPPVPLAAELFRQVLGRRGPALVPPAHPSVPLVLESEYADSLQGALSIEDILNLADDAGLTEARFEPVCLGQRRESVATTLLRRLRRPSLRRFPGTPDAAFPGTGRRGPLRSRASSSHPGCRRHRSALRTLVAD